MPQNGWLYLNRLYTVLAQEIVMSIAELQATYSCTRQLQSILVNITDGKVKWSRYRPDVAQRVVRGIDLLFHDRGTRRGWVVSSTPRPHFTPGKISVPILQEAGRAPDTVWRGGKSRPHRDSIADLPARSQSLYRLSIFESSSFYSHPPWQ